MWMRMIVLVVMGTNNRNTFKLAPGNWDGCRASEGLQENPGDGALVGLGHLGKRVGLRYCI